MPTATRDLYNAGTKPPKLRASYQITITRPSSSGSVASAATSSSSTTTTMPSRGSRELPMPIVTRITSLSQAQATLQHCAGKLSHSWQSHPGRSSPPGSPIDAAGRRHFQQWLEQWEQAFTAYLSFAMAGMKSEDITQCRVLKANHLACTILASEGVAAAAAGPFVRPSFEMFDREFHAIVELAGAVINSRAAHKHAARSESPEAGAAAALDVREPLYVVMARCERAAIRNQATDLIRRFSSPR